MKVTKREEKELGNVSEHLQNLVKSICDAPEDQLSELLKANNVWGTNKGNLMNWINVLNKFDDILERVTTKYELTKDFVKPVELDEKDTNIVVAVLDFTYLLLTNCSSKSVYASSHRLYDLLNSPTIPVIICVLRIFAVLAKKFSLKSSKRTFVSTRKVSDRLYPFALFLPACSLVPNGFSLIDFVKDNANPPPKWKQLEYLYFNNPNDLKTKDSQDSTIKKLPAQENNSSSATSSPIKKRQLKEEKGTITKVNVSQSSKSMKLIVNEEDIRKLSLQQIFDKGSEKLPSKNWLRFCLKALMAKAFNSNSYENIKLRHDLITIKTLAISTLVSVNNEHEISARIFEADPSLLSSLVDLVNWNNPVPNSVRCEALRVLDSISSMKNWSSEIVRGLGGSVPHGLLYQNLRHIKKQLKDNISDELSEACNVAFFKVVRNLVETKSMNSLLVSVGLIQHLNDILSIRSECRTTLTMATNLLHSTLSGYSDNVAIFRDHEGFNSLVTVIKDEVDFALNNPGYGGGPPKLSIVHYSISFKQASFLRSLLKLTNHLIQKESGDSVRNLFDSSLLNSINQIMSNVSTFGCTLLSFSLNITTSIINNEPTSFMILKDAGTIDLIVNNFENFFVESSEVIAALPNIIGAISLNTEGLEKIQKHQLIQKFFTIFDNNKYAKALVTDDLSDLLSGAIDELARHYPQFKPIIVTEVVKLIERLPTVGSKNLARPQIYKSEKGNFYRSNDEEIIDVEENAPELATWESSDEAYVLENASVFIGNLIMFSNTWISIMDRLPFERWIPLICLKNSPYDYFYSNAMYPLNGALKYFDDEKRDYVGRHIIDKASELLNKISDFANSTSSESLFHTMEPGPLDDLFNELININNLLFSFTDVYCNPHSLSSARIEQLADHFYDEQGIQVLQHLGALLRRTAFEEYKLRTTMPTRVANETAVTNYDDGFPPLRIIADEVEEKNNKGERNSAKFKNSSQVRFLIHRIHSSITTIFSTLSELPSSPKQDQAINRNRGKCVKIVQEIGKILSGLLTTDLYETPSLLLVLVNTIQYCLINSTNDKILTFGSIMFMQENGYIKLREVLIHFWNTLITQDNEKVKDIKPVPYVKDFEESIVASIVMNILVHFNKICIYDQIVSVPQSFLFYEGDFDGSFNIHESDIRPVFVVQSKFLTMGALLEIFDEDSLSAFDDNTKLPTTVVEEIIKLAKCIYSQNGVRELDQADGSLLKIDWKQARTPYNRIQYLQSIGFQEDEATEVLIKSRGSLSFLKSQDLPEGFEDLDKWKDIKKRSKSNRYHVPEQTLAPSQYQNKHTIMELEALLQMKSEYLLDQFYLLTQIHPQVTSTLTDFLISGILVRSNISNFQETLFTIVEFILSFEFPAENSPRLAAMIGIFAELLLNETVFYGCHSAIGTFIDGVVDHLKPENANTDWGIEIIVIIGRLTASYNLPDVEKLNITFAGALPKPLPVPFKLSAAIYDQIFDVLINISKIDNPKNAFFISRILAIYAGKPDYAARITKSNIIKQLIVHICKSDSLKDVAGDNQKSRSIGSQIAFTMLVRRCFESKDFITERVNREISKQFTSKRDGSKDKPKDLGLLLKDAYGTVLRSPEIFVEELVKVARLSNFSEPLKNWLVSYHDVADKDVQMIDAKTGEKLSNPGLNSSDSTSLENQTGIIHLILTELMTASKTDWTSEPALTEEEKKTKDADKDNEIPKLEKTDSYKNKNCAYIIYLLKLLSELLASYKQSKIEFLTFSKKQLFEKVNEEPVKPRSTSLNFLLHQFISGPGRFSDPNEDTRRLTVAKHATKVIVSFISCLETKELKADPKKVDPDMTFIRKFTVDSIQKIIKEISTSTTVLETRYQKLVSICKIIPSLLSNLRDKLVDPLAAEFDDYHISKIILDSDLITTLSQILADVDLNYPEYFFVLESVITVLNNLGSIKHDRQELFKASQPNNGVDEEEVEEDENDFKEETPDLFQNSTLGMYDIGEIDSEEEFTDDEIGYDEDDVSDDDRDDDDDDIDEELLSGRNLEIVYSDDEDEEEEDSDEGGIMIGSDEGEVVEDSESESEDENVSDVSDMNSDSDSYIEYDLVPGAEVDEEEYDSVIDENSNYDDQYISEDEAQGDYDIEVEEEGDEEDNEVDSELEAEMEHMMAEDETGNHHHHHHHHHLGNLSPRAALEITRNAPLDDFITDDENEYDSENSNSEDSLDDFLGRDHADVHTFHNRGPRVFNNGTMQGFRGSLSEINFGNIRGNALIRALNPTQGQNFDPNILYHGVFDKVRLNEQFSTASTRERWNSFAESFFSKNSDHMRVFNTILNAIYEPSKEHYELLKKEKEAARLVKEEERKKQLEEQERARKAEEEEARANEEAANEDLSDHADEEIVDLENEAGNEAQHNRTPIMVTIGDREVDIAGTDIDPEFFEALPDDMREEVFTQHIRERRAQENQSGTNSREIAQEFLDALPEGIREEILAQEAAQTRFSELSQLLGGGNEADANIENPDNDRDEADANKKKEKQKVFYTPLVDNAGVAALIRYVFVPQSFNGRKSLYHLLGQISINKKTRAEVLGYLVAILQYGISDQESLEKTFIFISNAAVQTNSTSFDKSGAPKTPTSKTHHASHSLFPHRTTPFIVASQALEAIQFLLESEPQLRYYFLTEHEGISLSKKPLSAKKPGLVKPSKFPLNTLLALLNKGIIRDKSNLMDLLSRIIQITTRPLHALKKAQMANEKKRIELPSVLNSSLRNVITILVSDDCSSRTFQQTLSAIQNLLVVCPGGKVFATELSKDAKKLGDSLVKDFKILLDDLSKNTDAKDYDSEIMVKYTSSDSDQSKLLRVLTALDYLFGKNEKKDSESTEEDEKRTRELTEIYNSLELGDLWGSLSETLECFEANKNITTLATALLPIIEALMVICKHSKVKDIQNKDVLKYENKKVDFTNEPIENLFFAFTDAHKKILNTMVRSNPKLMSGPFTMLVENPRVLEFDNKKNYFDRQLHSDSEKVAENLQISVRRDQVFLDSYRSLFFKSKEQFRDSKLEINFKGEAGVDAGGVTREWYQVLSRQMFNPDYALFLPIASDKTTFHPNRTSWVNPEHLSFFKFIGRVIGKAIYDNCFLDCHFSRDVYKSILGRSVSLKDLETIDLEYYNSLMWMLENDITDVIIETFSVETDDYGEVKIIDLIPDGHNISVTEENKNEYVRLVVEYRLQLSVKGQVDNFLQGFHEIIPKSLISIFDEQELELLISGLPDIDVDDWKNNTVYVNYSASSKEISYFWRAVRSFDKEERAKLLQFATGTSKVPLNGFKELEGSGGANKFSIHKDFGSTDRLPSSHTCFNQIDLPAYDSYETLRGSLLLAITEGHEGFGIA